MPSVIGLLTSDGLELRPHTSSCQYLHSFLPFALFVGFGHFAPDDLEMIFDIKQMKGHMCFQLHSCFYLFILMLRGEITQFLFIVISFYRSRKHCL